MPEPRFLYSDWAKTKPDTGASKADRDRFNNQEFDRWQNGYNGLTGPHYFMLTQCKIKSADGSEIRPWWRDVDEMIFQEYENAIKAQADILYVKRREVGLTTIFGGVVPMCTSMIFPGSNNLITSADKERIENIYLEKLSVIYDNLAPGVKPEKASPGKRGMFMQFGKKNRSTGEMSGLKSLIICKETVDKPSAFETYRAKSVFIDEFFLHPHASKVRISAQACVKKGQIKIAPVVMGGSCGITSDEGIKEGIKLWRDAVALNILTVFIPGWMGISEAPELDDEGKPIPGKVHNFCPNGYSDEERATEWILKTRERLKRAVDKSAYITFVKEYPLTIEEVFTTSNQGILPEEVMHNVQKQKIRILNEKPPVMTYNLVKGERGIDAMPSASGKFHILEKPQKGLLYLSGSDVIPWNTEAMENHSKYAISIKKPSASTYVAYYAERHLNSDLVISNCLMLQEYYNGAKTMLENNHAGVTMKTYKDLGVYHLLADRPSALGIKFVDKKESKGYFKNGHTTERGTAMLIKYLLNHTDKIWFMDILDEISQFLVGNTDILDSMIACEFNDENYIEKFKKAVGTRKPIQVPVRERDQKTGKTITVWKTFKV